MSCIKFPASKADITKSSSTNLNDYAAATSQLMAVANQVFGDSNWSHAITNQTLDFIDYVNGKYQAGCVSIVRVQLKDGVFHEDMCYSCSEGSSKGSAIQRARLGSFNGALKKALICFGNEIKKMVNRSSSRPTSPAPTVSNIEPVVNKVLQVPKENIPDISSTIDSEPFAESIPMSQTDALMGIVDLDQFDKDHKSNAAKNQNKDAKLNSLKPTTSVKKVDVIKSTTNLSKIDVSNVPASSDVTILKDKDKKSNTFNNDAKKEVKVNVPKASLSTGVSNIDDKPNSVSTAKKENKPESSKLVVSTAMTEEEMRLERKRKQREMQEEFKRKEEYKRKCGEPGAKQPPNPRY